MDKVGVYGMSDKPKHYSMNITTVLPTGRCILQPCDTIVVKTYNYAYISTIFQTAVLNLQPSDTMLIL